MIPNLRALSPASHLLARDRLVRQVKQHERPTKERTTHSLLGRIVFPGIISPRYFLLLPARVARPYLENEWFLHLGTLQPRMPNCPGSFQRLVEFFMASARKNIHRLQILVEVEEKKSAITTRLDFNNDAISIRPNMLRMAIGLLPRLDKFRLRKEDVFSRHVVGGICKAIDGPVAGNRARGWVINSQKSSERAIKVIILATYHKQAIIWCSDYAEVFNVTGIGELDGGRSCSINPQDTAAPASVISHRYINRLTHYLWNRDEMRDCPSIFKGFSRQLPKIRLRPQYPFDLAFGREIP